MKLPVYFTMILCLGAVHFVGAQSSDQNYIKTTTYLKDDSNAVTSLKTVQYFDGLGRLVQTVQQNAGPNNNGQDLIFVQEYDNFGRASKAWLPIPRTTNTGEYYTGTIATDAKSQYNDTCANSLPVYEPSPLNRVVQQYGPGQAWRTAARPVKTDYLANTALDSCIYYYMSGDALAPPNGYYAPSSLYVTKTTDEDNKVSYEFKDKLGRVVLQRQMDGTIRHDTYYVYDDFGNLRWALPPMVGEMPYLNQGCAYYGYYYKYDERNRCIEKRIASTTFYYVYDKADRLIFSQDGEQRLTKNWTFYKYDALGRMILTGVWKNSGKVQADLNTQVMNLVVVETDSIQGEYGYSKRYLKDIPAGSILQVNYYDNYKFKTNASSNSPFYNNANYNYSTPADFSNQRYGTDTDDGKSKGLLTGTIAVMLDNPNTKICTVFYYDNRGRVIQSIASNHLSGYEKEYINYSFTGKPVWKYSVQTAYSGSSTITETYKYAYDHADRLTTTKYKLGADNEFTLSTLSYDSLGRVASKKQSESVATTAYDYTIRNWLKNINTKYSFGTIFEEKLYYNESYAGNTPLYNGNISAVSWRHLAGGDTKGYRYTYDGLNRLKLAQFLSGTSASNRFTEEVSEYDKNGNIKRMKRYAGFAPPNPNALIDDLTFNYGGRGNQLNYIDDAVPATTAPTIGFVKPTVNANNAPIDYNANASMKYNYYNGIAGITYNVLNLPEKIQFMYGHHIQYSYDASGMKHRVLYYTVRGNLNVPLGTYTFSSPEAPSVFITDYCAGGHIVYENNSLKRILNPEGYVTKQSNGTYSYYYYAKDHLGNNRAVFLATPTTFVGPQQEISYYPFGMPHYASYPPQDGIYPAFQPYKFGGKEYDEMHGLNWYDQGARPFNGVIPISPTPDPLAEKNYSVSPYVQWGNNPVRNVDLRGDSVTVLNLGGTIGHSAMLIQNDEGKWQYYSYNGDWIYEKTGGIAGGKPYHDTGEKAFNSPQEFLESSYNTEGSKEEVNNNTVDNYGFSEGYVIPTSQEQDKAIRETFTSISEKESYDILSNNCSTVVQKSLEAAGIKTYTKTETTYKVPANHSLGESSFTVTTSSSRPILPNSSYKSIMNLNPQGWIIRKK